MNHLLSNLEGAGLSRKEAEIYLTLLRLNNATAYKVSKISEIKRPTTYLILESLLEKGYVLKTPAKSGTTYSVKPPEELVNSARSKLNGIISILPDLKSMYRDDKNSINTYYFEGLTGIEDALNYKMDQIGKQKMIGFFARSTTQNEKLHKILAKWANNLEEMEVKISGVTPEDEYTKEFINSKPDIYEEIIYIDKRQYSSNISIDTISDFVRIVDYKNFNGLIIENKDLAQTIHQIFKMIK